jgi:nucleoside phosphorylase
MTEEQLNPTIVIFDDTPGTIEQAPGGSVRTISSVDNEFPLKKIELKSQSKGINAYVIETKKYNLADPLAVYRHVEALRPTHIYYVGHSAGLNDKVTIGDVVVGNNIFAYNHTTSLQKGPYWQMESFLCSNSFTNSARNIQNNKPRYSPDFKLNHR